MTRMTTPLALAIALTSVIVLGGETELQQQKYFNFWKPHAGQWTICIKESGKEDITGTFSYRPSPTKVCYVARGHSDDGTPVIDGLYGYDSGKKCWVDVEILKIKESYVFRTVLLRANVEEKLREGSTVSLEVTEAMDGKTTEYTATRVYKTLEKNRIVMVHQNRTMPDGTTLPDVTVTVERKD